MLSRDCTLVLLSCDSRADIWRLSLELFDRYWPDCPFPKLFVGETQGPKRQGFPSWREFLGGAAPWGKWSDLVAAALATVQTEYVLLTMDDFLLTGKVDSAHLLEVFEAGRKEGAECIRLNDQPLDTPETKISHQASIWKRETFASLLRPGECCWDMEKAGPERYPEGRVLVVNKPALPYLDSVQAGSWTRRGRSLLRREGLEPNASARPVLCWNNI